jgi:predicted MFS family arabinose efflux permease
MRLPQRRPEVETGYLALIGSLGRLLRTEAILRQRALTASLVMAAFSLFWTAVALRLSQPPFDLSQRGIALFALVGAGGAVVTPFFGRAGDRGWTHAATIVSHLMLIAAIGLVAWAGTSQTGSSLVPLMIMGLGAVLLDVGVTGDQTLGRRAINMLQPGARGRLNGLFVGLFFLGGAVGSALAGITWDAGGWPAVCGVGAGFGVIALMVECAGGRR